jgi:lipopolysaccharide/colanic/teichoic acid biosynthesis glycosyltransferase
MQPDSAASRTTPAREARPTPSHHRLRAVDDGSAEARVVVLGVAADLHRALTHPAVESGRFAIVSTVAIDVEAGLGAHDRDEIEGLFRTGAVTAILVAGPIGPGVVEWAANVTLAHGAPLWAVMPTETPASTHPRVVGPPEAPLLELVGDRPHFLSRGTEFVVNVAGAIVGLAIFAPVMAAIAAPVYLANVLATRRLALSDRTRLAVKRTFDVVVGVPAFVAAIPIIAVAALAVKLVSPGRAFFAQVREGNGGRRVRVWKIRTMIPNAAEALEEHLEEHPAARDEWERRMKLNDDPRILPYVGQFLRASSIDELPQLWSVITGDLSLVGPRPFPDYHLSRFDEAFRRHRREVTPGITGYWQVTARTVGDLDTQEAADSFYIDNWSLRLDVWILARTVGVVLSGNGT